MQYASGVTARGYLHRCWRQNLAARIGGLENYAIKG